MRAGAMAGFAAYPVTVTFLAGRRRSLEPGPPRDLVFHGRMTTRALEIEPIGIHMHVETFLGILQG